MIPITRKDKDDINELRKEIDILKVQKQEVENQQQTKMSELIKQIKEKKDDEIKEKKDDEIKQIKEKKEQIKEKKEQIKEKKDDETKKYDEEHTQNNGAFCPTCLANDHKHKMVPDEFGLRYHCTGPECNKEYVMIDKTSDYRCLNCNSPIKKPENEKMKLDSCPFCGGKKSMRHDWSKLWKVTQNKTQNKTKDA